MRSPASHLFSVQFDSGAVKDFSSVSAFDGYLRQLRECGYVLAFESRFLCHVSSPVSLL